MKNPRAVGILKGSYVTTEVTLAPQGSASWRKGSRKNTGNASTKGMPWAKNTFHALDNMKMNRLFLLDLKNYNPSILNSNELSTDYSLFIN